MQGIYSLIYSIAISWCIDWSEPLRCGSSGGHKRTELGICAFAGCSPAFPEVLSCVKACCYCSPSSSVSLSSGMSDSRDVGVGGDIPSPPWLVTACPAPQCFPWVTLWPQCHPLSRELPSQLLLCFWECWALSACLELILMPGKDDSVRESSSYHLIPHGKRLGQHKVLNDIREAIDPMEKQVNFLSICKQDRASDTH